MAANRTGRERMWWLLAPEDSVPIKLAPGPWGVRRAMAALRDLTHGTPVVLLDHRPGGRARARRVAASGLITVDHEYVALPSLSRAIVLAEDSGPCLRWACRSLVAPAPGITWAHAPVDAGIRLLRHRPGVAAWLAPGRVIVGRRA